MLPARALAAAALAAALLAGCGSSSSGGGTQSSTAANARTVPPGGTTSRTEQGGSSLRVIGKLHYERPPKTDPVLSGTAQIAYRNITARPNTLRVKVGTTVRWTNYDEVEHNVTSQGGPQRFASHNLGPGGTFDVTLTHRGLVLFDCTIHPATMNGTIEVL